MFTGIVTAIGTITNVEDRGDTRVVVACPWDPAGIDIGASIACSGVCLTVTERGGSPGDAWFAVDVSQETVSRTVPGLWEEGRKLNLEPSLRLGDELGGHLVTGHVDAVGEVAERRSVDGSIHFEIRAPKSLAPFIAAKGSITVGKQADLVILEKNPITTDPAELERIQIMETFSRGRSVFAR